MSKYISFYIFLGLALFSAVYFAFSRYINNLMSIPEDVAGPLERVAIFVCLFIPLSTLFYLIRTWNSKSNPKP